MSINWAKEIPWTADEHGGSWLDGLVYKGWEKVAYEYLHRIQTYIDEEHVKDLKILDAKEKFSGLVIYVNEYNSYVESCLSSLRQITQKTCILCGRSFDIVYDMSIPICRECTKTINKNKIVENLKIL